MTFDELLKAVLVILPDAEIGEDNDGQLVVHTGLYHGIKDEDELTSLPRIPEPCGRIPGRD